MASNIIFIFGAYPNIRPAVSSAFSEVVTMKIRNLLSAAVVVVAALTLVSAQETFPKTPEVPFVPTSPQVVDAMLKVAKVTNKDIVYDLGSGDGRIVIAAAKKYGARGVGIDISPDRIREANENARQAGVTDKVKFIEGDLFESDFSEATVVTMYLLSTVNMRLRPILFKQLKPGTRIISHAFDMGDWKPEKTVNVDGRTVYFWTIPADKKP